AGAAHRIGVDQIGRKQLLVAALPRVLEEELHHRELQPRQRASIEREARARHLARALEVDQPQLLADLGVLARAGHRRLLSPGAPATRSAPASPLHARRATRGAASPRRDSPPPSAGRAWGALVALAFSRVNR